MLVLCSEAPLAVLFYSIEMTDQLCFITWSHAYSLLPYPTFVKRKTYVLEPFMNQDRNGVAHLLQNGRRAGLTIESVDVRDTQCDKSPISNPHWQLENYHQSRVDHNGNSKERCVSDKNSWIIPLNTEGVIHFQDLSSLSPQCRRLDYHPTLRVRTLQDSLRGRKRALSEIQVLHNPL
jgi:hypothetical protein